MKPCIIGLIPDFFISLKLVPNPIAASAVIIRNLLNSFAPEESAAGITPKLLVIASAINPMINHGNSVHTLTFFAASLPTARLFFLIVCRLMNEKISTVGIMDSVRVSFTIVAKSPAASEKAYPAATTLDVSFTAVPAQRP